MIEKREPFGQQPFRDKTGKCINRNEPFRKTKDNKSAKKGLFKKIAGLFKRKK